jgi:predicted HTH transcriptional regulator
MNGDILDLMGLPKPEVPAAYPNSPGARFIETSRAAAAHIAPKAPTLRAQCFASLKATGPATADEMAARLGVDRLAIRPRFSELSAMGIIADSGDRRLNASGVRAVVWRVISGVSA